MVQFSGVLSAEQQPLGYSSTSAPEVAMADPVPSPALLHRMHMNELALGAAVEELAIRIAQRGSTETSETVRLDLDPLQPNADFIGAAIVALMADP